MPEYEGPGRRPVYPWDTMHVGQEFSMEYYRRHANTAVCRVNKKYRDQGILRKFRIIYANDLSVPPKTVIRRIQ